MLPLTLRTPDNDLIPLLRSSSSEDLENLVEFILKAMTSQLDNNEDFVRLNPRASQKPAIYDGDHTVYVDAIAAEIQKFGGNTIVNMFRGGKGVSYLELVRDIADKMGVKYNATTEAATLESLIQIKVLEKAYEKMSDEERKAFLDEIGADYAGGIPKALPVIAIQTAIKLGGFAAYQIALAVANAVSRLLLGKGLAFGVNAALTRWMSMLAGPIGWAVTVLWTIVDIAGPAYRVTIPCVLHISYLRQKSLVTSCSSCGKLLQKSAKFCPSCGAKQDAA